MNDRFLVIGSAPDTDLRPLLPLIDQGIRVVCADGGMATARRFGVAPELFIGDLDSGTRPEGVEAILLPPEKDYTDLHTAVLWILSHGGRELYLAGCTNGRADHYLANLYLLELIYGHGGQGVVLDVQNRMFLHPGGEVSLVRDKSCFAWSGSRTICVPHDFPYISLLPLDAELTGVTLRGLKYPLERARLERSVPIGVSNEMAGERAAVLVERGRSLLILSKDVNAQ